MLCPLMCYTVEVDAKVVVGELDSYNYNHGLEANFMMKNGYLTPRDIEGKQYYQIANGELTESTVMNIRDVEFGGLHLSNVKASVVKSQRAPLLLGQSALQKLGKIEIDNDRKVLKITYRKLSE